LRSPNFFSSPRFRGKKIPMEVGGARFGAPELAAKGVGRRGDVSVALQGRVHDRERDFIAAFRGQ
jgi:hypothetical protein